MYGNQVDANKAPALASVVYLTVAGVFAVFLPHILEPGLIAYAGLLEFQADIVASAEMLGVVVGVCVLCFNTSWLSWRKLMALFLALTSVANAVSTLVLEYYPTLSILRFVAGLGAGGMIALGLCMLALTSKLDRNFGIVFMVMMACAGLGMLSAPVLLEAIGPAGLIVLLALVYFGGFLLIRRIPEGDEELTPQAPVPNIQGSARSYSMFAVLTYGLATGLAVSGFPATGIDAGIDSDTVNRIVIFSLFAGVAGGGLVILVQGRLGQIFPVLISLLGASTGVGLALVSTSTGVYWLGLAVFSLLWCVGTPCILATLSEFDDRGTYVLYGIYLHLIGYTAGVRLIPSLHNWHQHEDLSLVAMALLALSACLIIPGLWAVHRRHQMTDATVL